MYVFSQIAAFCVNSTNRDDIQIVVDETTKRYGKIDILVKYNLSFLYQHLIPNNTYLDVPTYTNNTYQYIPTYL